MRLADGASPIYSRTGFAISQSTISVGAACDFCASAGRWTSAMMQLLERIGRGGLTVHGFRSTFRDWAAECTPFPNEVVEMALAHAIRDKTESAYRRRDLFDKRRELMEAWASTSRPK